MRWIQELRWSKAAGWLKAFLRLLPLARGPLARAGKLLWSFLPVAFVPLRKAKGFFRFVLLAFGPHVALMPLLMVGKGSASISDFAAFPGIPCAWLASGAMLGHRVLGFGWLTWTVPHFKSLWANATSGGHLSLKECAPGVSIIVGGLALVSGLMKAIEKDPVSLGWMNMILFSIALVVKGSYGKYRLETEPRNSAREKVLAFYKEHPEIHASFPRRRLEWELRGAIRDSMSDDAAWQASAAVMAKLQEYVDNAKAKLERTKKLDKDIAAHRQSIDQWRKKACDPDVIADKIAGIETEIRRLEEEKELISSIKE